MKAPHAIRANGQEPLHQKTGGWQVVYTGFVLILLCFFIMLTSFASLQDSKITRFARSFSNAVSVFNDGRALEKGETMIHTDALVVDKEDPLARLFEKVSSLGDQTGLDDRVQLQLGRRGVIMTLADRMLFESGRADLSPAAAPLLDKIGSIINALQVRVDIEGHTDDRPIRNAVYASNWELSTARAVNVLRYLIGSAVAPSEKLTAVGRSKYQPVAPNSSRANRARNRRVEFIFIPGEM